MATSILSSLFGRSALTAINENTGAPVLRKLKVISVDVDMETAVTDNPLSTEQVAESSTYRDLLAADLQAVKIVRPTRVKICAMIDNLSVLNNVLALYADTSVTLSISSRSLMMRGLCITEVVVDQNPEALSASYVDIELEQASPPSAALSFLPEQAADLSSVGLNIQVPPALAQTAAGLYNKVSSLFG